jgi:hypothetical protein
MKAPIRLYQILMVLLCRVSPGVPPQTRRGDVQIHVCAGRSDNAHRLRGARTSWPERSVARQCRRRSTRGRLGVPYVQCGLLREANRVFQVWQQEARRRAVALLCAPACQIPDQGWRVDLSQMRHLRQFQFPKQLFQMPCAAPWRRCCQRRRSRWSRQRGRRGSGSGSSWTSSWTNLQKAEIMLRELDEVWSAKCRRCRA